MLTWQLLWRPEASEGRLSFAALARTAVPERLSGLGASEIWLHVTEEVPPLLSLIPWRRGVLGLVSVHGEAEDLGGRALAALRPLGGSWAGYRVTEAQPVPRARPGAPGSRSPGACLLTLFRRRAGLSREELLRRWHGGHTPLSLEIHPLRAYVRGTVEAPLGPGAPPWEGIVTESFGSRADLLNPLRLFGGPRRAPFHMLRVGWDIASFMDLLSMECYLVAEYGLVG
jgi:hypothetical protein